MLEAISSTGISDADIAKKISVDGDQIASSIVNRWRRGVHKRTTFDRYIRVQNLYIQIKSASLNE